MYYTKGTNVSMKKVLVDVNVFMDVLQARKGVESSLQVLLFLKKQDRFYGFISAITLRDIFVPQAAGL